MRKFLLIDADKLSEELQPHNQAIKSALVITQQEADIIRRALIHANGLMHSKAKKARSGSAALLMEAGDYAAVYEKIKPFTRAIGATEAG